MTITIPSDFTENSGTLLSSNPVQPEIKIAHNTGQGFIAEKMTTSAAEKLQTKSNTYSRTTASKDGFNTGSEGASKLSSGISQLQDGTKQLQTGTTALQSGSAQLVTGLSQYTSGVSSANSGSAQLVAGAQQLATQLQKASDLAKLDAGLTELTQQLEKLRQIDAIIDTSAVDNDAENLGRGFSNVESDMKQLISDPAMQKAMADPQFSAKVKQLTQHLEDTKNSATNLGVDSSKLQSSILSQINTLKSSLNDLSLQGSCAVEQAQQAIKTLNASLTEVSNGIATQAVPGAQQLAQGASQLNTGLSQLNANSGTLIKALRSSILAPHSY
ncbi:hypothetical protein Pfo_031639 [Paulownia fortunei]|nr:hypothetical protein Pfo_031639 [Paulownia fortunei]